MELLYDERGATYKVPVYCCANPIELCGESGGGNSADLEKSGATASDVELRSKNGGTLSNNNSGSSSSAGGAVLNPNEKTIVLKVRINPGDINLTVPTQAQFTMADLKQHIAAAAKQVGMLMFKASAAAITTIIIIIIIIILSFSLIAVALLSFSHVFVEFLFCYLLAGPAGMCERSHN
jgi:hypothetical protein